MKPILLSLAGLALLALGFVALKPGSSAVRQQQVVTSDPGTPKASRIELQLAPSRRVSVPTAESKGPCSECESKQGTINALYEEVFALEERVDELKRDCYFYRSQLGEGLALMFKEGFGRQYEPDDQETIISYVIEPLGEIPLKGQLDEFLVAYREFRHAMTEWNEQWWLVTQGQAEHRADAARNERLKKSLASRKPELIDGWRRTLAVIFGPEGQRRIYE